jgi:hypothetical protein
MESPVKINLIRRLQIFRDAVLHKKKAFHFLQHSEIPALGAFKIVA